MKAGAVPDGTIAVGSVVLMVLVWWVGWWRQQLVLGGSSPLHHFLVLEGQAKFWRSISGVVLKTF